MLEDWLRERIGKEVHLVFTNGMQANVTVDEVAIGGGWFQYTGGQGLPGVMATGCILLAEDMPSPELRRLVTPPSGLRVAAPGGARP